MAMYNDNIKIETNSTAIEMLDIDKSKTNFVTSKNDTEKNVIITNQDKSEADKMDRERYAKTKNMAEGKILYTYLTIFMSVVYISFYYKCLICHKRIRISNFPIKRNKKSIENL